MVIGRRRHENDGIFSASVALGREVCQAVQAAHQAYRPASKPNARAESRCGGLS